MKRRLGILSDAAEVFLKRALGDFPSNLVYNTGLPGTICLVVKDRLRTSQELAQEEALGVLGVAGHGVEVVEWFDLVVAGDLRDWQDIQSLE